MLLAAAASITTAMGTDPSDGDSPQSIIDAALDPAAPAKKTRLPSPSSSRKSMIGLTPKSGFLAWLRKPTMGTGNVLSQVIKKELRAHRDITF